MRIVERTFVACVGFAAGLLALTRGTSAQAPMAGHVMEMVDEIPPDQLPPPRKLAGVGNVHLQITATPEAQAWFDQGLNLFHDFWDYESARAFEQSVRVDPQCAMCYWGLSKAEGFYHGTSRDYAGAALARAVSLQDRASDQERLYIQATTAGGDAVSIWRTLVQKYPDDSQAKIFLALGLEDGFDERGEPRTGQREALTIFQDVMKADPDNSAANHYYIHALEASAHPEQARHSAEILAQLAPASGHMVHMPGHIFFRMGDYARAGQAFAASLEVDERYMREQHVAPDLDWNYVHNLMYAIANSLEAGKLQGATMLSAKLSGARGELESTLYTYSVRDSITRIDPRLPVALRTADWRETRDLLAHSEAPANRPNLAFLAAQLATFASGMAALEAHDLTAAAYASSRLDAALARMTPAANSGPRMALPGAGPATGPHKQPVLSDALLPPILSSLAIMSLELRGSLLTAQGKGTDASPAFAQAARAEKALGYREPPAYIRPVYETEAGALMAAGDWTGARGSYEQALAERPRSGFALYGLALASERAGNTSAAVREYGDFLQAWDDADAGLPQIVHARAYLKDHPSSR